MSDLNNTSAGRDGGSLERVVSPLRHGTEEEHRATLKRAKAAGVSYVWSGDILRNQYLAENLRFGHESGILSTEWVESDQESGWKLKWANAALSGLRETTKGTES